MSDTFDFTVTISAAQWSELQRRLRFVEAALVQALRGQRQLKEWFGAAELAELGLPGLPGTRQGLLKRAHAEKWEHRSMYGSGGERYEFHFSSLPRLAFEALLERIIITMPGEAAPAPRPAPAPAIPPRAMAVPLPVQAVNTTPAWLLPLLRVVRSDRVDDVDDIVKRVASRLPPGMAVPTPAEVREALRQFGYGA